MNISKRVRPRILGFTIVRLVSRYQHRAYFANTWSQLAPAQSGQPVIAALEPSRSSGRDEVVPAWIDNSTCAISCRRCSISALSVAVNAYRSVCPWISLLPVEDEVLSVSDPLHQGDAKPVGRQRTIFLGGSDSRSTSCRRRSVLHAFGRNCVGVTREPLAAP